MSTTLTLKRLETAARLQAMVCDDVRAITDRLRYMPDVYSGFPGDESLVLTPETLDRIDKIAALLIHNLCQAIRDDPNLTHLGERP